MQQGMRIKSKDIRFEISIFYVAINSFIDFLQVFKINVLENYFPVDWFIYLLLKLKELAVSQRQAHDDLVNSDFLKLTS